MNQLWTDNLRKVEPYVPGEQSKEAGIVKLNANENPYPPSPAVLEAIKNFDCASLRLYPDANAAEFKAAIAGHYGVGAENVFIGNGSDDVLALSFQTFFNSNKPIAYPDITYRFYPVWCALFNIPYKTFPLGEDFRINILNLNLMMQNAYVQWNCWKCSVRLCLCIQAAVGFSLKFPVLNLFKL